MLLPRSWYPLCRSTDVGKCRLVAVEAFGGRLCVFRGKSGAIGVLDARCSHMGADLTAGAVVDEAVRCPLHGRCFSARGERSDRAQPACAQKFLHACERYGVVFAFLGGHPDFSLPEPNGIEVGVLTRPRVQTQELSWVMVGANAFDTDHLAHVHGRDLAAEPQVETISEHCIRLGLDLRVVGTDWHDRLLCWFGQGRMRIETECWGGNFLIFHHRRVGTFTVHAALPRDEKRTTVFTISGRTATGGAFGKFGQALRLRAHHHASLSFVHEDECALQGLQLRRGNFDQSADRSVVAWLEHFDALPRADAS
jgi:phenylpropionate dioxygenase-like ring-hydroxylating dioxygenase large terminal subunit